MNISFAIHGEKFAGSQKVNSNWVSCRGASSSGWSCVFVPVCVCLD